MSFVPFGLNYDSRKVSSLCEEKQRYFSLEITNLIAFSEADVILRLKPTCCISSFTAIRSRVSLCIPDAQVRRIASFFDTLGDIFDQSPIRVALDRTKLLLVGRAADKPVREGARFVEEDLSLSSNLALVRQSLAFDSSAEKEGRIGEEVGNIAF